MKVLYVAKHGSGGNQDEDAIAHAFEQLGHQVVKVDERHGREVVKERGDFVLFHKWYDPRALLWLKRQSTPRVFFYFDLVDYPDETLEARCAERRDWMARIMPLVDLGFCTDGDWAEKHPDKLVCLRQGADGRVVGRGRPSAWHTKLLYTGSVNKCGKGRHQFMLEMRRYGQDFTHIDSGIHGRHMADIIADADICLAPPEPILPRYWSNRVYNTLGFGGFLLHPWAEELAREYQDGKEIVFYRGYNDLHEKIRFFLSNPEARARISEAGLRRTREQHLYLHRVRDLLRIVKERLGVGDGDRIHQPAADA